MSDQRSNPTRREKLMFRQWAQVDDRAAIRTVAQHALGFDTVSLNSEGDAPIHVPQTLLHHEITPRQVTMHQKGVFGHVMPFYESYRGARPDTRQAVVFWLDEEALGRYAGEPITDAARSKLQTRVIEMTRALRRQNGLKQNELSSRLLFPNETFREVIGLRACAAVVLALDPAHAHLLQDGIVEPMRHAMAQGRTLSIPLLKRNPLGPRAGVPDTTVVKPIKRSKALVPVQPTPPAPNSIGAFEPTTTDALLMPLADLMRGMVGKPLLHPVMSNGNIVLAVVDNDNKPRERIALDVQPFIRPKTSGMPTHILSLWLKNPDLDALYDGLTAAMNDNDAARAEKLRAQIEQALLPIKESLERKCQAPVQLISKNAVDPNVPTLVLVHIDHPMQQERLGDAAKFLDMAARYHDEVDRQWQERTMRKPDDPKPSNER